MQILTSIDFYDIILGASHLLNLLNHGHNIEMEDISSVYCMLCSNLTIQFHKIRLKRYRTKKILHGARPESENLATHYLQIMEFWFIPHSGSISRILKG